MSDYEDMNARRVNAVKRLVKIGVGSLVAIMIGFGSFFVVPEGHISVVKQFAKAKYQTGPGIHPKFPLIESVKVFEVRQRKNVEELAAATGNQLPITAVVSINWTVDSSEAMDIYVKYGGLDQFESRILDPKFRQVAKASISQFRADELIRDRNAVVVKIQEGMVLAMEGYPITVNSPQVENITLPPQYLASIMAKEKAREDAETEKHTLKQQEYKALQAVNTAEAAKQSAEKVADGKAYAVLTVATANAQAIILEGNAEASKVRAISEALKATPMLVEYEKAKRWDGAVPRMMFGGGSGTNFLLDIGNVTK